MLKNKNFKMPEFSQAFFLFKNNKFYLYNLKTLTSKILSII